MASTGAEVESGMGAVMMNVKTSPTLPVARHSREIPATLGGVLAGLANVLHPFDLAHAIEVAHQVPLSVVEEFGLESGLAGGGVDLAFRGRPERLMTVPWLNMTSTAILSAASECGIESAWVEVDLTAHDAPQSTFVSGNANHAWPVILSALTTTLGDDHDATLAALRVSTLARSLNRDGIAGSYPTRFPPVAGSALRVDTGDLIELLSDMSQSGAVTLDPHGPEIAWLVENLDEHCLTVAAAAHGSLVCGVESRFEHNIRAAKEGSWSRILSRPQPWPVDPARVGALNALPGAWRYSGPLPTVLITGVSHLKVGSTPEGARAKVYFGGKIELGGVR